MKHTNTFAFFRIVIFFAISSFLLASCTGVRYTYFNKQKVQPAAEETQLVKAIPSKPFLAQTENGLKEKTSVPQGKNSKQQNVPENAEPKKPAAPITPGKVLKEINIAKYIPKESKSIQSETGADDEQRTLMIVLLVCLILIVLALLGDELIWLLFLALLILLIYFLVKYLGIFN